MDKDRDGTMRGADIFDVAHFPTAHYVTRSFAKTASGYTAIGALTLRGVTREVPDRFPIRGDRRRRQTLGHRQTQAPGFRRRTRRLEKHQIGGG